MKKYNIFRINWRHVLAALALALIVLRLPALAQKPATKEDTPRAEERPDPGKGKTDDTPDRLAQSKLELRVLESRIAVKQAELKAEEERLRLAQAFKNNTDSSGRKGFISPTAVAIATAEMLDQEARVIAKRAEFDEATARYDLAKQRLIDGKLPPPDPTSGRLAEMERRLAEVEQKVSRLIVRVEGIDRYKLRQ